MPLEPNDLSAVTLTSEAHIPEGSWSNGGFQNMSASFVHIENKEESRNERHLLRSSLDGDSWTACCDIRPVRIGTGYIQCTTRAADPAARLLHDSRCMGRRIHSVHARKSRGMARRRYALAHGTAYTHRVRPIPLRDA